MRFKMTLLEKERPFTGDSRISRDGGFEII